MQQAALLLYCSLLTFVLPSYSGGVLESSAHLVVLTCFSQDESRT